MNGIVSWCGERVYCQANFRSFLVVLVILVITTPTSTQRLSQHLPRAVLALLLPVSLHLFYLASHRPLVSAPQTLVPPFSPSAFNLAPSKLTIPCHLQPPNHQSPLDHTIQPYHQQPPTTPYHFPPKPPQNLSSTTNQTNAPNTLLTSLKIHSARSLSTNPSGPKTPTSRELPRTAASMSRDGFLFFCSCSS